MIIYFIMHIHACITYIIKLCYDIEFEEKIFSLILSGVITFLFGMSIGISRISST